MKDKQIQKIKDVCIERTLFLLRKIYYNGIKFTFMKDKIPFYPSILSLGAYDGHITGESIRSKQEILKPLNDLQDYINYQYQNYKQIQ